MAGKQWFARCYNCRYSRRYGGNKIGAECFSVKHGLRNGHAVRVYSDAGDEMIVGSDKAKLELPGISESG